MPPKIDEKFREMLAAYEDDKIKRQQFKAAWYFREVEAEYEEYRTRYIERNGVEPPDGY